MAKTVAFIFGFTEGKWHGKRFRRLLREQGYKIVQDAREADIVIAHSGGCFTIPTLQKKAVLVMINPPYWPDKTVGERGRAMTLHIVKAIRPGNKPFYHTHKTARNMTYLIRHARTNRYMAERAKTFNLETEINHPKTLLVRNTNDPWLTPNLDVLTKLNPRLKIVRMSGDHDDCWLYPERYVNLLKSR